jgi:hypothetical protein
MDDPIVSEVHATRQRILSECGGDLDQLIERLRTVDESKKERLVTADEIRRRASANEATL